MSSPPPQPKKKLLDQVRNVIRLKHFLTHLAVYEHVASSTQNQALSARLFLYRDVLGINLPDTINVIRARKPQRLPTVLTRDEVHRLLDTCTAPNAARCKCQLTGTQKLIAQLLYGGGLAVRSPLD
jgi:site-specific recombinase XerD